MIKWLYAKTSTKIKIIQEDEETSPGWGIHHTLPQEETFQREMFKLRKPTPRSRKGEAFDIEEDVQEQEETFKAIRGQPMYEMYKRGDEE